MLWPMEYHLGHHGSAVRNDGESMLNAFFRKQPKKGVPPSAEAAPEVPYDPSLVAALTHQHRELVMLLVKAHSAAQQGRYEEVRGTLQQFKDELVVHLRKEHDELQDYLSGHLKGADAKDLLKEMRANSSYIERAVDSFLNHYLNYPVTERTAMRFGIEISGVSEEFCERVERAEGSFYTLYMPPETY